MWQTKYLKAIRTKKQLIGDAVMRRAMLQQFSDYCYLQEVRFPNVTADMVMIDPKKAEMVGIEIKSDRDELQRLPQQLRGYLRYCPFVIVATTLMHRREAMQILQEAEFETVGLLLYIMDDSGNYFEFERRPLLNDVKGVGLDWMSKRHQLQQWRYLLEMLYN